MKEATKIWYSAAVAVLILGTLFSFYTLYHLAAALERSSANIDLSAIDDASATIYHLFFIVGFSLLFGIAISLWLLYSLDVHKKQALVLPGENELSSDNSIVESKTKSKNKENIRDALEEIWLSAKNLKEPTLRDQKLLSSLCMKIEASQGLLYKVKKGKTKKFAELSAAFALSMSKEDVVVYDFGEGLIGQVAKTGKKMCIADIPEGYIEIKSGLGAATPKNLAIIPILHGKKVTAVVEVASFSSISSFDKKLIAEAFIPIEQETGKSGTAVNGIQLKEKKPIKKIKH